MENTEQYVRLVQKLTDPLYDDPAGDDPAGGDPAEPSAPRVDVPFADVVKCTTANTALQSLLTPNFFHEDRGLNTIISAITMVAAFTLAPALLPLAISAAVFVSRRNTIRQEKAKSRTMTCCRKLFIELIDFVYS